MIYLAVNTIGGKQLLAADEEDIIREYMDKPEWTVFRIHDDVVEELGSYGDWTEVPKETL